MEDNRVEKYGLDNDYTKDSIGMKEPKQDKETKAKKERKTMTISVRSLRCLEFIFFLVGIMFAAIILLLCTSVFKVGRLVSEDTYQYYQGLKEDYGKYYEMESLFKKDALFEYNKQDIDEAICQTIVLGLNDKYAQYYTKQEFDNIMKQYFDNYSGVGIATVEQEGQFVVTRILSGSPAEEAGVKVGDVIVKVDGKKIKSKEKLTELVSGETGTKVVLTVKRDGEEKDFEMYRAEVEEKSVECSVQDSGSGIGYIRIKTFRDGTTKEFKHAVKELKKKGCDKFIIDLRQNTGGVEKEGIELADELLPSCRIISEKNKKGKEKIHNSDQSQLIKSYVLLVDGYTASASEIVSAAVQGNGGILIGSKTYGKGLVQTVRSFKDGSAVKYTSSEYYAPDGSKINEVGLTPNITSSSPVGEAVKELKK